MSNSATFSPTCASPSRSRGSRSPRHVQAVTMRLNFRSGGTIPGSRTLPPFCAWGAHSVTSFSDRLYGTMQWKVGQASCLSRTAKGGQWTRMVRRAKPFGVGVGELRDRLEALSYRRGSPPFAISCCIVPAQVQGMPGAWRRRFLIATVKSLGHGAVIFTSAPVTGCGMISSSAWSAVVEMSGRSTLPGLRR